MISRVREYSDGDDDIAPQPLILPYLKALRLDNIPLCLPLVHAVISRAGTIRSLTCTALYMGNDENDEDPLLMSILESVGENLDELCLWVEEDVTHLTPRFLHLVPNLSNFEYQSTSWFPVDSPTPAILDGLPKFLKKLQLGFRYLDVSFLNALFRNLKEPSYLPKLTEIPQIFLPTKLQMSDADVSDGLLKERDCALASLQQRGLDLDSNLYSGKLVWSSEGLFKLLTR